MSKTETGGGMQIWETGGGCTAYGLSGEHYYALVTAWDGPELPTVDDLRANGGGACVGIYSNDDDNDCVEQFSVVPNMRADITLDLLQVIALAVLQDYENRAAK